MPTIQDVAKHAGVAPMTVSRVLNNNGYVSNEKRQRVEAAIRELNYIPNALGTSLRMKRTQTLALVVSDLTNPFWTTLARGVEDTANQHGYHIIIGNTDESPQKQKSYLLFLQKKQVDGFLIVPTSTPFLDQLRVPFVVLDRRIGDEKIDIVRCDSVGGAYELTKYLLQLGHRHIAIITGRQDHSTACDRVAGFQKALEEFGLADLPQQIYWGEFNQKTGYDYTQQILHTEPRTTAIFATNNFIAIGTMLALRERGIQVPQQMSVVAFDDLPAAITFDPFLTVAAQPAYEMGQQATQLLLSRLSGTAPATPQEIVLPIEIIIRRSTGVVSETLG